MSAEQLREQADAERFVLAATGRRSRAESVLAARPVIANDP